MIKLFQYHPAFGVPNPSPFCMKLEAYLNLSRLDYETVLISDPRTGPTGKAPYVEIDGRKVGDSAVIIDALKAHSGIDPDETLTAEQRAVARAIGHMLEEHLYFVLLHSRWIDDRNWPVIRDTYFGSMPAPVRGFFSAMVRRQVRKALIGQGMGRHSPEQIQAFGFADIDALADYLGDKSYLMGATPTTVDCIGVAFVGNLIHTDFAGGFDRHARSHDNLVRYGKSMMVRLFPNWSEGTAKPA